MWLFGYDGFALRVDEGGSGFVQREAGIFQFIVARGRERVEAGEFRVDRTLCGGDEAVVRVVLARKQGFQVGLHVIQRA